MGLFDIFSPFSQDDAERHYNDIYYAQPNHQANWTHEAIAGAAGFAAMHAYESHLRATGQEPSHALMKEILAGIAAAEVDKIAETKGLDWIDRHKAKKMAEHQAHELAERKYQGGTGWEYAMAQRGGPATQYNYGREMPYYSQGPGAYYPPPPVQDAYYAPPAYPPQGGYYQPTPGEEFPNHHHHHHHHHRD